MSFLNPYFNFLGWGDFSDVYLEESSQLSIRWEDGKIENISSLLDSGVGLRFVVGETVRFGHTNLPRPITGPFLDTSAETLMSLKNALVTALPFKKPMPFVNPLLMEHKILKRSSQVTLTEKVALLKKAYGAAKNIPHLKQVAINFGEKDKTIGYLNSDGNSFLENRSYTVFGITVTVERSGDVQTAYEAIGGVVGYELFDGDVVENLAKDVAARAIQKLNSPQAPVGEMPVVIASSAGGTLIHEAIGHSLEADAVLEGTSPAYIGKIGQVVANSKLTVFDNPTVPSARGSFHFDDEGVPSEATKVIDNGVLKDYLFDRMSAKKAGRLSNGHGRRESYAHRPIPRMSNTYIAPGPDDPVKILAGFQNGLLVTKMGGGQVNTANGDFVFEVEEGFKVENGKRTMVRGATLLGNGPDVLMQIDQVGTDHGWGIGTCGKEGQGVPVSDAIPTLHIKKMVVGGNTSR